LAASLILPAEEGLGIEVARHQFQVQLDEAEQLSRLGRCKRVGRQQRMLRVLRFQVFEDHGRLAQRAFIGLEVGHLAQRTGRQIGLADPDQFFFERTAFFEQGELDLVVVVAGGKTAEGEHGKSPVCMDPRRHSGPSTAPAASPVLQRRDRHRRYRAL
jgi:hypothetical protein